MLLVELTWLQKKSERVFQAVPEQMLIGVCFLDDRTDSSL